MRNRARDNILFRHFFHDNLLDQDEDDMKMLAMRKTLLKEPVYHDTTT